MVPVFFHLVRKIALKYQKQTYTKPKAASWCTAPGAGLALCSMIKLSSNRGLGASGLPGIGVLPPEVSEATLTALFADEVWLRSCRSGFLRESLRNDLIVTCR